MWHQLWQPRGRHLILFSVFIFAFGLTLYNGKILSPERGDPAMWDYMAQSIVRGQVPYRDVVELKTPLPAYMSALAIVVGRAAGINELIAIRYVGIILACLLLVAVFAVTEAYTNSRLAAPKHGSPWNRVVTSGVRRADIRSRLHYCIRQARAGPHAAPQDCKPNSIRYSRSPCRRGRARRLH